MGTWPVVRWHAGSGGKSPRLKKVMPAELVLASKGCELGDALSCEHRLYLLAEQESEWTNEQTLVLRYFQDACTQDVLSACETAEA